MVQNNGTAIFFSVESMKYKCQLLLCDSWNVQMKHDIDLVHVNPNPPPRAIVEVTLLCISLLIRLHNSKEI